MLRHNYCDLRALPLRLSRSKLKIGRVSAGSEGPSGLWSTSCVHTSANSISIRAGKGATRRERIVRLARTTFFFSLFSPSTRKGRQGQATAGGRRTGSRSFRRCNALRIAGRAARRRLARALQSTKQYAACRRADSTSSPSLVSGTRNRPRLLSACASAARNPTGRGSISVERRICARTDAQTRDLMKSFPAILSRF